MFVFAGSVLPLERLEHKVLMLSGQAPQALVCSTTVSFVAVVGHCTFLSPTFSICKMGLMISIRVLGG